MEHRRRLGAICAFILGLALALGEGAVASEPESAAADVAPDSISEVMLEDTGLELEDTPSLPESDAIADADVADEADEDTEGASPSAPARAAPSP